MTSAPSTRTNFIWPQEVIKRLSDAGKIRLEQRRKIFDQLLNESRAKLSPLGEPLELDFGVHRRLKKENDYSDWLAWLLKNLKIEEIVELFVSKSKEGESFLGDKKVKDLLINVDQESPPLNVDRESYVENGHEGHSGRLDLTVELTRNATLVLELKRGSLNEADTGKQNGYFKTIEGSGKQCCYVLLANDQREEKVDQFTVISYTQLCLKLRDFAAKAIEQKNRSLILVAMALGFVGAIEANLLGLAITSGLPSEVLLNHLKIFLRK